ncbi:MAG: response regulator, partial [Planctomycetes bacterium]|nr:response regulator [Planctomycetota bacterium]
IEIEYAENGVDALDKLKQSMFNLVLTDLMMPMMDGLQLLDEVSRLYPQTPVVLMTAYGNELLAVEALERGAASYVPKDQKADRLVDTVKKVLARSIVRMNGTCLHDCSAKLDASFNLENDPAQFSRIIDMIQQMFACIAPVRDIDLVRLGIALDEALSNALYHGNLELTLDDLQKTRNSPESLASLARVPY